MFEKGERGRSTWAHGLRPRLGQQVLPQLAVGVAEDYQQVGLLAAPRARVASSCNVSSNVVASCATRSSTCPTVSKMITAQSVTTLAVAP